MFRIPTFIAVACALATAVGCARRDTAPTAGGSGKEPGRTKVILQTDWYAQAEHGGFYQALAKGYYREAGLEVEIRQGDPGTRPQQMVATGKADFAIGRSDDVITYVARDIPVEILGAFMQRDPQAIMFHRESGVRSFKDLDGRNVMAVPGSVFIAIMEDTYHIKVAVTPSDYGMSRFLADKNFIQQCFITNEPYYVQKAGADIGVLPIWDTGFSPYRVWYARKRFATEHPDVAKAFAAATLRGWADYMAGDRGAAHAMIAARNPKMEPDFLNFSVNAMQQYRLISGDPSAGEALGQIRRERIEKEIAQLGRLGLLDKSVTVDDVVDAQALARDVAAK